MSTSGAWQRTGDHPDRFTSSARVEREFPTGGRRPSRRTPPPPPGRAGERRRSSDLRASDRWPAYESGEFDRPTMSRRSDESVRGSSRYSSEERRGGWSADASGADARGQYRAAETGGGRLRGSVAVLAVFLVTLAGAAVDSFLGIGLGTVTLVALVGATALAALLVRRRDLVSVLVAPPLVFVAVAITDLVIAPSARFSLTALAPLLIRGFPAMGIATAVGLVLAVVRRAAGR